MTSTNMATITASLERSLQNCSLNQTISTTGPDSGIGISSSSDSPENHQLSTNFSDATLDLHSQISLPYHWEQCLDLKTGEIYYINWRTGMKAKEDPRTTAEFSVGGGGGDFYSEEDDSSYDSEESSSESSPSSSSRNQQQYDHHHHHHHRSSSSSDDRKNHVLVVGGCKSCLMYFMVPKQVEDCPKCCGQLLHFDRSENGSP